MSQYFRKHISCITIFLVAVFVFSGCGSRSTSSIQPQEPVISEAAASAPVPEEALEETAEEASPEILLTQYDGSQLILAEMPQSICAHSYGLALILHELGLNITSIMTTSRPLPKELKNLPSIGSPTKPDFELIKSYDTDLFISSDTFKEYTEQFMKEQNIPANYLDITLYSDTRRNIEMLGNAFGKLEEKERLLQDIDAREAAVLVQIQDKPQQTIAIILGTSKSFLFSTEQSYIGEMAEMLGLRNIVEGAPEGTSSIAFSVEQLIDKDPDVILRIAHGGNWEEVQESFDREFNKNNAFMNLAAVKNEKVFDLEAELFTANAGTRSIESLETLAQTIFGLDKD